MPELKRISVRVPEADHTALKTHCAAKGITIESLLRQLVDKVLKKATK
jgi:predicted DNA binding CopG/RHH family protein